MGRTQPSMKWELNGTDQAELSVLRLSSGVTAPKPWDMHRAVGCGPPTGLYEEK